MLGAYHLFVETQCSLDSTLPTTTRHVMCMHTHLARFACELLALCMKCCGNANVIANRMCICSHVYLKLVMESLQGTCDFSTTYPCFYCASLCVGQAATMQPITRQHWQLDSFAPVQPCCLPAVKWLVCYNAGLLHDTSW